MSPTTATSTEPEQPPRSRVAEQPSSTSLSSAATARRRWPGVSGRALPLSAPPAARRATSHHAARSVRLPQHACGAGRYRLLRQLVSSSQGRGKDSPAAPSLARSATLSPIETARSGARPANSWLTPGCWQRSRVAKGVCSPESAGLVDAGYPATSKRPKGHARARTTGARSAYVPCLTIPLASSPTGDCRSAEPRR
jgi:hypothetical protein